MTLKINKNQNFLIDKQIIELSKTNSLITHFDENLLSGCSYDLRVGQIVRSRSRLSTFNLNDEKYYAESGECFTIETLEEVNLRDTVAYGLIFNKHAILGEGLFHPATTVDPGFCGHLSITFFNLGNTKIKIEKGMRICSIHFQTLYPKPELIYGIKQRPSYKEGDSKFALNFDNPDIEHDDTLLAKMYGEPITRLYNKIDELESKFDLKIFEKNDAQRKENRAIGLNYLRTFIGIILAAIITFYVTKYYNSSIQPIENKTKTKLQKKNNIKYDLKVNTTISQDIKAEENSSNTESSNNDNINNGDIINDSLSQEEKENSVKLDNQ